MAFIKSSDSILIKAVLTKKGKKLLARGKLKIAKFALSDDEVDYRLYNSDFADDDGYVPALKNNKIMEAFKTPGGQQYYLDSYDSGIVYLSSGELASIEGIQKHANIEYLPILVKNEKTSYAPTVRKDKYYVSINNETTKILNDNLSDFNFLDINDHDKIKIVVESGIEVPGMPDSPRSSDNSPSIENRNTLIIKKFLLDEDFYVYADNRLISNIIGIQQTSRFENYASGDVDINFNTDLIESPPISIESGFQYHATYLTKGVQNLMVDHEYAEGTSVSSQYSSLSGPRGSVVALNIITDNEMKVNSTGQRDNRFSTFGVLSEALFSEMPTRTFDYIDTTIYIIGATTNSRIQVPLRIIRYAGT
jgi:hypothetical protein